jgi:hypothetical protein
MMPSFLGLFNDAFNYQNYSTTLNDRIINEKLIENGAEGSGRGVHCGGTVACTVPALADQGKP